MALENRMVIRLVGERHVKPALAWSLSPTLGRMDIYHGGCGASIYHIDDGRRGHGYSRALGYYRARCHDSGRIGPTTRQHDGKDDRIPHTHDSVTPLEEVGIASVSRLALYSSGGQLGSHRALHLQKGPSTVSITAGRPSISILPSILVIAMAFGTAVLAAVRSKVKAVRECSSCQGYGVLRCKLCSGKGTIDWEGKMAHREPCPMCLGRRLIKCKTCGGGILFSRSLFIHKANKGEEALMETLQTLRTPSMRLFGSKNSEQDARLAESDEYSKEILSD